MYEITPEDFFGATPPERIMGTETEFNVAEEPRAPHDDQEEPRQIITAENITKAGFNPGTYKGQMGFYLSNSYRLYPDAGQTTECATPESLGALEAAKTDAATSEIVTKVVEASGIPNRGIFRHAGSAKIKDGGILLVESSGHHENFLIPS